MFASNRWHVMIICCLNLAKIIPQMSHELKLSTSEVFQACEGGGKASKIKTFVADCKFLTQWHQSRADVIRCIQRNLYPRQSNFIKSVCWRSHLPRQGMEWACEFFPNGCWKDQIRLTLVSVFSETLDCVSAPDEMAIDSQSHKSTQPSISVITTRKITRGRYRPQFPTTSIQRQQHGDFDVKDDITDGSRCEHLPYCNRCQWTAK